MSTTPTIEATLTELPFQELLKRSRMHYLLPADQIKVRRELAVRQLCRVSVIEARSVMYNLKKEPYFTERDVMEIAQAARTFIKQDPSKQSLIKHLDVMLGVINKEGEAA